MEFNIKHSVISTGIKFIAVDFYPRRLAIRMYGFLKEEEARCFKDEFAIGIWKVKSKK